MAQKIIQTYHSSKELYSLISNTTCVFEGDSITRGAFASNLSKRWTTTVCRRLNITEVNNGIDGQNMQSNFNASAVPSYINGTHGALFIALGLNDAGNYFNPGVGSPANFQSVYESNLDIITGARGWPSNKIILISPYAVGLTSSYPDLDEFVARVGLVASNKDCFFMDIKAEMEATPNFAGYFHVDEIHPNDYGYLNIADIILK